MPDERSERKCTQTGDTFAELNPSFCENCVFQVSKKRVCLNKRSGKYSLVSMVENVKTAKAIYYIV